MTEQTARALTGYGAQCQHQHFYTLLRKLPLSLHENFQIEEVSQIVTIKSESCGPLEDKFCFLCKTEGWKETIFSDSCVRNVTKIKLKRLRVQKL